MNRSTTVNAVTPEQHRRKERILTQSVPSRIGGTASGTMLKHRELYLLTDKAGDIAWELPHAFGLYMHDCRYVNGLVLTINGATLEPLSSSHVGDEHSAHTLTNSASLASEFGTSAPARSVSIRRSREIHGRALHETIRVTNHGLSQVHIRIGVRIRCEFEDIFVVKGFARAGHGRVLPPQSVDARMMRWTYTARDGRLLRTDIVFVPEPAELSGDEAAFRCLLQPGDSTAVHLAVTPTEDHADRPPAEPRALESPSRRTQQADELWSRTATQVRSSHEVFDTVLDRALRDLRMLRSRIRRRHYFAAGVPWFVTLFGRDTLIAAIETLPYGSAIARDTLRLLADYQSRTLDAYRDAEPGKILHELRRGELARLGEIPQSPAYYGTVDATMLFLILSAEYVAWSGDIDTLQQLRPNISAALDWMAQYGDSDGDGYFDYTGSYQHGLLNQGWKDSGTAIVNDDGSLATPPIALVEVQSYAFRAWRDSRTLLQLLGAPGADQVQRRAEAMRAHFRSDFWSDDLGCYYLARQQGGRPAAVVSSNSGQVLWGGIADEHQARRVAERLLREDMFSGWGIRTLSSSELRFNPISYHLGSVWPHDNALILSGARAYGLDAFALRIFAGMFDAAVQFPGFRLPELFCGYQRHQGEPPVPYPYASAPQAWAAGALAYGLWSLLGLQPDAVGQVLRVVRPVLPEFIDWLELGALRVGNATVDLRFRRRAGGAVDTDANVTRGRLRVEVQSGQ